MSKYSTFVIDKSTKEGQKIYNEIFDVFAEPESPVVAFSSDHEILRLEKIDEILFTNDSPDESISDIQEIMNSQSILNGNVSS